MSLLKRLFGAAPDTLAHTNPPQPSGDIQPVGAYLKEKFSRGIDYNLKIVIRGDRGVGKSTLLKRLKGEVFHERYVPTSQIQVATVNWNHGDTKEVVKVEVWDVVDKGTPRSDLVNVLKLSNGRTSKDHADQPPSLDATFIDVYKGAHGVILMMDMTKAKTFDYVCRELPRIPVSLPVLLLANFRDMGEQREITEQEVRNYLKTELRRPVDCSSESPSANVVHYCEASMLNGFGLLYIHKFFNLPFLYLQNTVLRRGLERNKLEISQTLIELASADGIIATHRTAYERFMKRCASRVEQTMDSTQRVCDSSRSTSVKVNEVHTYHYPTQNGDQHSIRCSDKPNLRVLSFEEAVDPNEVIPPSAITIHSSYVQSSSSEDEEHSPRLNGRLVVDEPIKDAASHTESSPTPEEARITQALESKPLSDVESETPRLSVSADLDNHLHQLMTSVVVSMGAENDLEQFLSDV